MTFARRKAWSAGQTRNWGGTQDRLTPAELVAGLKQHSTYGEGELSGRSTNQHHDQLTTNCKLHSNGANGKSCTRIFGFHEFSCICLRKWWALQVKIPHEYCCIVVSFYRKRYSKNWGLTYISVKMQEFKIGVITLLMPPRYIFLPEPLLSERKEKTLIKSYNKYISFNNSWKCWPSEQEEGFLSHYRQNGSSETSEIHPWEKNELQKEPSQDNIVFLSEALQKNGIF